MDGFPGRQWRLPLAGAKDDVGVGAVRTRQLGEAGVALDRRVSVTIEDASVDELFHQLLKSTGLRFQRRGRVMEILPTK